eukprot:scaffold376_cov454-Pavlova_lutheri.AAC.18
MEDSIGSKDAIIHENSEFDYEATRGCGPHGWKGPGASGVRSPHEYGQGSTPEPRSHVTFPGEVGEPGEAGKALGFPDVSLTHSCEYFVDRTD